MNIQEFRNYCLAKKHSNEGSPFGEDTLVFKVSNKIFALTSISYLPFRINLKCDPQRAESLREEYPDIITGGYHQNKKHWNSIYPEENIPDKLIYQLIDHSYDLVVNKLTKTERTNLGLD